MPSCKNCIRLLKECSLKWIAPGSILSTSKPLGASMPLLRAQPALSPYNPTSTPFNYSGVDFDTIDFELFHLYTTSTCSSLAPSKAPEIWRVEIPRLALAHQFLMHGLLAVSALHLAYLDPQRYYKLVARALRHESLALPHFRETIARITEVNCHSIFAFSGFVTSYALASLDPSESQYTMPSDDSWVPNWINLVRGSHALLSNHWRWLANGPFAPLLERTKSAIDYANNPHNAHLVLLLPLFSPHKPTSREEGDVLATCKEAFHELRRVWSLPYSACRTVGKKAAATIWPGTISSGFIKLLRERRPESLVILAHYCVLLNEVRNCWYFKGLAQHLIDAIRQCLSIEWNTWIQWPLSVLGMKEAR